MARWDHDDLRNRAYDPDTGKLITQEQDDAAAAARANLPAFDAKPVVDNRDVIKPITPFQVMCEENELAIIAGDARSVELYKQIESMRGDLCKLNKELDARRELRAAMAKMVSAGAVQ